MKLQEINAEIRRLRSLSYKEIAEEVCHLCFFLLAIITFKVIWQSGYYANNDDVHDQIMLMAKLLL